MGYYDENDLWIEDGTTYIFKPGSTPDGLGSMQTDSSEEIGEVDDDQSCDEEEVKQEVLWSGG